MFDFKRILVPVDFSECSKQALDYATTLAERVGADVDVLHAWTTPAYVSPYVAVQIDGGVSQTLEALAKSQASQEMERFLTGRRGPNGRGFGVRIEFGFEADTILAAAPRYDLLVMGTHGRTGFAHLMLGSVAERVVRRSPTPVLTVRSEKKAH